MPKRVLNRVQSRDGVLDLQPHSLPPKVHGALLGEES